MQSYRGNILKSNLSSGLPTRALSWRDYDGQPIQPCNAYYLPENSALPLVLPWIYEYDHVLTGHTTKIHASRIKKLTNDMSLHGEILAFIEYMAPTRQEIEVREDLVTRFTRLLASFKVPSSAPEPYGSYVTGLYLGTSDIDMFLSPFENKSQRDVLGQVHRHLMRVPSPQFHKRIVDILKASVPLLTITDAKTGLDIDLSAEPSHSIASTQAVVKWLKRDPELGDEAIIKMLVTVIKTFLSIRRCSTTYTGGVNSYALVWLVVSWVKLELPKIRKRNVIISADPLSARPSNLGLNQHASNIEENATEPSPDYGKILIAFLKFYGEDFDYKKTKIVIEPQPKYTSKPGYESQPFLLSLIDPADVSIDLGSRGYAIKHVAASFKEAHQQLTMLQNERLAGGPVGEQGILGKVLGGDFMRTLKERMNISSP